MIHILFSDIISWKVKKLGRSNTEKKTFHLLTPGLVFSHRTKLTLNDSSMFIYYRNMQSNSLCRRENIAKHILIDSRLPRPEKAMTPHSSTLAWKIPWTEKPGRLQSMVSHRVDWSDLAAAAGFPGGGSSKKRLMQETWDAGSIPGLGRPPGEGYSNPLPYSCLENPMDREAWWTTVHGVAKSQTQLSD